MNSMLLAIYAILGNSLIVEDNMELLEGLCRNLQEEGGTVFAASCIFKC